MHVATLELCRELHELSGWKDTEFGYWPGVRKTLIETRKAGYEFPAYDLGYLLRKLPGYPAIQKLNENEWLLEAMAMGYHASGRADTPEDAAAKLAIELLKQGVLTGEDKDNEH